MVKIVVSPGRRVWDRENHREAGEGDMLEVSDVEAKVLKFRGLASDPPDEETPRELPPTPPAPPMPAPAPPPVPQPQPTAAPMTTQTAEAVVETDDAPKRRFPYRRRDMQPENGG